MGGRYRSGATIETETPPVRTKVRRKSALQQVEQRRLFGPFGYFHRKKGSVAERIGNGLRQTEGHHAAKRRFEPRRAHKRYEYPCRARRVKEDAVDAALGQSGARRLRQTIRRHRSVKHHALDRETLSRKHRPEVAGNHTPRHMQQWSAIRREFKTDNCRQRVFLN